MSQTGIGTLPESGSRFSRWMAAWMWVMSRVSR